MNPLLQFKTTIVPIVTALTLTCFALSPTMQALSPPPDGGYPNRTTAEGDNALFNLTTGIDNTALGFDALWNNTIGSYNTAIGEQTLYLNISGVYNTATGYRALYRNIGHENTANGAFALFSNTTGSFNTANGFRALYGFTTGQNNTANGAFALFRTGLSGNDNTAVGFKALYQSGLGFENTAVGSQALFSGGGAGNTANGFQALFNNGSGGSTAIGWQALYNNSIGSHNTALGESAGSNVIFANNVICIGAGVSGADVDNSCFIGNIYTNVQPIVGTDPDSVTITSNGRLGRGNVSSRRYKHDIKPMEKASEVLYALKPVSFRYNKEYDATQTLAFGLIAEDVAEVDPDLVGRNSRGEPESVRYDQLNAMLLNEFLKGHRKVEQQEATIARQQKQIDALTEGLQKVSAQLEGRKSAPQVVDNNQ